MKIAVVLGSTRQGRKSPLVGRRIIEEGQRNFSDTDFELIDLKVYDLPLLPKSFSEYDGSEEEYDDLMDLKKKLDEADGYIFVVQEYNNSITAVLKTIFEYYHSVYSNKAAGIVSYGNNGGVIASQQLRVIFSEVSIADVRSQATINLLDEFDDEKGFIPDDSNVEQINKTIEEVIEWSSALAHLREND